MKKKTAAGQQNQNNKEIVVDTAEAAARLNLSVARVKQLALEGRIGTKVGSRYIFTQRELASFAKIHRPSGRRATP